jgi:hypothetical protein
MEMLLQRGERFLPGRLPRQPRCPWPHRVAQYQQEKSKTSVCAMAAAMSDFCVKTKSQREGGNSHG